jgi:hypothetical protein
MQCPDCLRLRHIGACLPNPADYDVVVMCECSGEVRDAFISQGLRAISVDLKPTRKPGPHWQGDAREVIGLAWPAMVAHPVCRYLTNAGVRWLWKGAKKPHKDALLTPDTRDEARWQDMLKGAEFFNLFDKADHIPIRVTENPIMHGYALELIGHDADQFIQPHWFGAPFKKATGLWKHGAPDLPREYEEEWYAARGIKLVQKVWLESPGDKDGIDREERRSVTEPQVARALAQYLAPVIRANQFKIAA